MRRREWLTVFAAPHVLWGGSPRTVRGALRVPAVLISSGSEIRLEGDKQTAQVLRDQRLNGKDLEVTGEMLSSGAMQVDPIHTKALKVHQGGKALLITYWCEVCSIRTYAPGPCMCCQADTELDLRERID